MANQTTNSTSKHHEVLNIVKGSTNSQIQGHFSPSKNIDRRGVKTQGKEYGEI
ncbi:hypothetical protein GLYMA_04G116800v4 [Glycine max]|uniref:Uncharacterized protein n=1 Tax=Glycine max TaxID=3847 RepID=A0A0R0K7C6_SOYBN|nr:hypothetical protein JHK85_010013 [Glycine max]KAG5066022.1 hypothetical protein JHK86_009753 [Glycine max]KAH1110945.1 hypothetical protein GYH30_009650 [Glycine max]KRH62572.1 hypothetical protein GLYMA_04G116800v4 [Glycine max]